MTEPMPLAPETLFEVGAEYTATTSFEALRSSFERGERLLYWRYASSFYDGMHGWFFLCQDGCKPPIQSWDLEHGADLAPARTLFERTSDPHPLIAAALAGDVGASTSALSAPRGSFDSAISRLAVETAIAHGYVDVTLALARALDDAWVRSNQPLRHAVFQSQVAVAKALVGLGQDPRCTAQSSQSALDVATMRKDEAMLEALEG